jgi:hypothetical protein
MIRASAEQIADRNRDERKHHPRMSDVRETMPSVDVIVTLVRSLDDENAAKLIQKYADATASIEVESAAREIYLRVARGIEGGLGR